MKVAHYSPGRTLRALGKIRFSFHPEESRRKARLLSTLSKANFRTSADIAAYHDLLCFMRAYPDNAQILSLTERELRKFSRRVTSTIGTKLEESGIAGTSVGGTFSYDLSLFLSRRFESGVDVDSEYSDLDKLWEILPHLVSWQEADTLDNAPEMETSAWLQAAAGNKGENALATTLGLFERSTLPVSVRRYFFESLEWWICWKLGNSQYSRTLHRAKSAGVFFQRESLRGRSASLQEALLRPAMPLTPVTGRQAEVCVADIKGALGVRARELYSLTHSSAEEVYTCDPGRGLRIIVFGNVPEIRLPAECNFGAMLVRNGMPVGYGISAMLFDQAEIAINIFPAFRGGESPFVIEEFFRLFYHHFGARVLIVRKYQVGHDNDEALESGSFWFYYKLGFRPVQPKVAALARRVADRIAKGSRKKSSIRMLKRLAESDMMLDTRAQRGQVRELEVAKLGLAVTLMIAKKFSGDRQLAIQNCCENLRKVLKLNDSRWPVSEQVAFARLAPLICCVESLPRWSLDEKMLLARMIRAKGGKSERAYVQLSQEHVRFREELYRLAQATKI